jgi:GT2 family glycosyltransferase
VRTVVITVVSGRHNHLQRQQAALAGANRADVCVVVAMADAAVRPIAENGPLRCEASKGRLIVVDTPAPSDELPLAGARNQGADVAIDAGAELLVFLDVDCIPGPRLLETYAEAAARMAGRAGPVLLCGPVTYLPPLPPECVDYPVNLSALTSPHPARPAPPAGQVQRADDLRLFWSLSFAITAADWTRVGGFDEAYTGYGAEDTDLAMSVGTLGGEMYWVGGADAYHQWHRVSDPPVEHLDAIIRNANLFHAKWGWTPMEGWLCAFEDLGLARYVASSHLWRRREPFRC